MLTTLIPKAYLVDVEMRNLNQMRSVVEIAKQNQVIVVASFHDFKKTPSTDFLLSKIEAAKMAGAQIAKIATNTNSPADLACLLCLFEKSCLPLSVMGMGELGKVSRLLFAKCGSVLNYGWLARPNVSGQLSALELAKLLEAPVAR